MIVVLGMHRSGTSAVAGAFERLGYGLGGPAVPAADDNPLGYFENAEAVDINEELLLGLGRGWDDLRPLPVDWRQSPSARRAEERIVRWLASAQPDQGRLVLKDPRLCLVFPLWRDVLAKQGIDVRVLLAHRALPEVIASLVRRDAMAERHALLLALRHVFEAERSSRGLVRAASCYDTLLADREAALRRILDALALEEPESDAWRRALAGLDPGQRHHRDVGFPVAGDLSDACEAVAVAAACKGPPSALESGLWDVVERACATEAATLQPRAGVLCAARRLARQAAITASRLDAELAGVRALALARLAELEAERKRVEATEQSLAAAASLALERQEEVHGLSANLLEVHEGLRNAESLAIERLGTIGDLDAGLKEARQALATAEALAVERLALIGTLDAALSESRRRLAQVEQEGAELASRLASLHASWSWRLTSPLRWMVARLRGLL